MPDYKIGDRVTHSLSDRIMVVLAASTDNMVNCRYIDNNGLFCSQWFYPEELLMAAPETQKAAFAKEINNV